MALALVASVVAIDDPDQQATFFFVIGWSQRCAVRTQAIVATAHKIARVDYHLLQYGEAFVSEDAAEYEHKRQERELKQLMRRAKKLGYNLVPQVAPPPVPAT